MYNIKRVRDNMQSMKDKKNVVVGLFQEEKKGVAIVYALGVIAEAYQNGSIDEINDETDMAFREIAHKAVKTHPQYFNFNYDYCVIPILNCKEDGRHAGLGSACLVRINNNMHIITAAHVLIDGNPTIYIPLKGYHNKQIEDFIVSERLDIAVLRIHDIDVPYFFDLYAKKPNVIDQCIVGFRGKSYRAVKDGKHQYKDIYHVSCVPTKSNADFQITATLSIENVYRGNDFEQRGAKLEGMSGGACIETYVEDGQFKRRLAGIFTNYCDKSCEVRSTKIEEVLAFIEMTCGKSKVSPGQ